MYKSERFEMRLSEKDGELLDRVRGSASRAAWIRNQIRLAAEDDPEPIEVKVTQEIYDQVHPPVESPLTEQPVPIVEAAPVRSNVHQHRWVGRLGNRRCSSCGEEA